MTIVDELPDQTKISQGNQNTTGGSDDETAVVDAAMKLSLMPWIIGGISFLIILIIAYIAYRRARLA